MPAKSFESSATTQINDHEATAAERAIRLVSLAETLKLITLEPGPRVTVDEIRIAFEGFAKHEVGRHIGPLPKPLLPEDLATCSQRLLDAVEASPMPALEWPAMLDILEDDLLARLLCVSNSSLRRYRSNERSTPDAVAERLHVISQVVSDLSGSYNDFGIRRWFYRPRVQLDGAPPVDVFTVAWSTGDAGMLSRVRELARALLGAGL